MLSKPVIYVYLHPIVMPGYVRVDLAELNDSPRTTPAPLTMLKALQLNHDLDLFMPMQYRVTSLFRELGETLQHLRVDEH